MSTRTVPITNEPGCALSDTVPHLSGTVPHLSDTVPHLSCRLEAMIAEGLRLKALAQMRRATKASEAREATILP